MSPILAAASTTTTMSNKHDVVSTDTAKTNGYIVQCGSSGGSNKSEAFLNNKLMEQTSSRTFTTSLSSSTLLPDRTPFYPKKAVIVSKQTMLEYECHRLNYHHKIPVSGVDDARLIKELTKRHINVDDLRRRHDQQQSYIRIICEELKKHGIDYKVVNRTSYTKELIDWCDFVISAGGDGTFLTAARKVRSEKPVIGINTDPIGSEGHLCLTGKSNRPANEILRQFLNNDFRWTRRQRIRVTMLNDSSSDVSNSSSTASLDVSATQQNHRNKSAVHPEENTRLFSPSKPSISRNRKSVNNNETVSDEEYGDDEVANVDSPISATKKFKFNSDDESDDSEATAGESRTIEPLLALNEVFIGESHAARVSYYDVQLDDGPLIKQKSSGMTICTGTGSTSWHYNINRLTEQNLKEILEIVAEMGFSVVSKRKKEEAYDTDAETVAVPNRRGAKEPLVEAICKRFNERLVFEPSAQKMAFSIRDPVFNATFPKTASRGFVHRIRLKSRCTHAHLILDGATSIPFNRGAEVMLEMYEEDALRTAILI